MATNPDDRYQTADEAAAALRSLVATEERATVQQLGGDRSGDCRRPVPEPVAERRAHADRGPRSPPVLARVRSSEPKAGSLRSRWAGRGTKANRASRRVRSQLRRPY